ncbi:MAG: AIR synthase related protein [Sulfolobales archaeon]|nr:AIR synthase related protein [Sulfolobales archaeon]MCX8208626.1 AIR synthase related protein [Sulfolobales archaeon]MDW8010869.1 AIR synthase related protein [Sulfolobales archaeon]
MKKLAEVGEYGALEYVLDIVSKHLERKERRVFGVGDDAQAINVGGLWIFLKIDGTSASSSMYPWLTPGDLGYRVALSSVTDLIAKNSRPLLLSSSITVSSDLRAETLLEIIRGVVDLAEAANSLYVGGDINKLDHSDIVIDVASVGISSNPKPSTPFEENLPVYSVKCLGLSSIPAALYYLKKDISAWMDLLKSMARPKPPLAFLDYSDFAEASTDVSDGLSSLRKVLERSGVDLVLSHDALCPEVVEFSREEKVDVELLLSFMGEEYTIVSTIRDREVPVVKIGRTAGGCGRIYLDDRELIGGWDNFLGYRSSTYK